MQLRVNLRGTNKIHPPYLIVHYIARKTSDINTDSGKNSKVAFIVTYSSDVSNFWTTMIVVFVVTLLLILLLWIFQIYRYQRINLIRKIDLSYFFRLMIWMLGISSHLLFWVLFVSAGYSYLAFKGQTEIEFLPPTVYSLSENLDILVTFQTILTYCFFAKVEF